MYLFEYQIITTFFRKKLTKKVADKRKMPTFAPLFTAGEVGEWLKPTVC